jgi:protein involved in polysaccharide export with SLBB domain
MKVFLAAWFLLSLCFAVSGADSESPSAAPANYRLAASDIVSVNVFQEPDLKTTTRISGDGSVSLPLIGVVNLGGRTLDEASSLIRDRFLKGYLRNPQVQVVIERYASRYFSVLGHVNKPGNYELRNESPLDVVGAVAMAGGFARSADETSVVVKRRNGSGYQELKVRLRGSAKGGADTSFTVLSGDQITVKERWF